MEVLFFFMSVSLRQEAQLIGFLCGVQDVSIHAAMMTDEDRNTVRGRRTRIARLREQHHASASY